MLSQDPKFIIPDETVEKVVPGKRFGADMLKVILQHDRKLRFDQGVLNACSNKAWTNCVDLILENNPDLIVPEDLMLKLSHRALAPRNSFALKKTTEIS